jgi:paraquat-inducible protein B
MDFSAIHRIIASFRNRHPLRIRKRPLVTDIRESSYEANKTMKETRAALVSLQQILDPDSPLAVHLNQTLDSLTETSESLGEFTDYLQRNPNALVRGRYMSDKGE